MPTKMYATIAYITSSTRQDDIDFYVSAMYDSDSMWHYVQKLCRRAQRKSVQLLDITVLYENGEQAWNWRP